MTHSLVRVEHVMGMAVSLDLDDDRPVPDLERLADGVFAWLRTVDEIFSTYRPESEISRLARGELRREECAPEVGEVLDRCAELWDETDGYFDINAGGRLDPSGYVKGWAVQRACDRLLEAGSANHCLNAGGDIFVRGAPLGREKWRVGIRHPWEAMSVAWVLEVTDTAVATSGTYERGLHVVDPFTGRPVNDLRSVTVVGPELGTADAYATAALAMGRAGIDWLAALPGHESAVVTESGEALRSDNLPVAANPEASGRR
ncbi:FAD:protein FMN transferase [Dactylosporangium vinaceum]|uniref:FAD:protein FMN transferase n=1 Tax=Dactylosporangium vinaceum TaxID=53362 RepID=A0ABV5M6B9_9ACTN|nr:FAD:protein FMN transferase [Dactylosporangium vinaceum]